MIAHPDDESMFFSPALTTLERDGERAVVLCLSSGDACGLGETRKRELVKACRVLGVKEDDVVIIEHPDLKDGSTKPWPPEVVSSHVRDFVKKSGVKTLLTFDELGVSGHADHAAVNRGVSRFLQLKAAGVDDDGTALDAFALTTTGIVRKYSGLLDVPLSLATAYPQPLGASFWSFDPRKAWRAMVAHRSQFVWYRRLFVVFSRYAYVNTFRRMQLPPPPRQMPPPPPQEE